MTTVGALSFDSAHAAMQGAGLDVAFGPFVVRLRIREPALARLIHDLYADYPAPDRETVIPFCEVAVTGTRFWRSFARRGFVIHADGLLHGSSLDLPLALPSLEWTINYLIATAAHRYVMLHAAVVERNGRALILPGNPGSGKSTLCAALLGRGWRLLSDEFALLRPEDGLLQPMPRLVSLKNQSIDIIRQAVPGLRFGPAVSGTHKGKVALAVPPLDSIRRQGEPARPAWIVFPTWREGEPAPGLTPLPRARAFAEVTEHAMNYEICGETGYVAVRRLVESCSAATLSFSRLEEAIDAVESLDRAALRPVLSADAAAH